MSRNWKGDQGCDHNPPSAIAHLSQQRKLRGERHEHATRAVHAEPGNEGLLRKGGECVANVEPGKAQVIEFAPEVFETCPKKRGHNGREMRAELQQGKALQDE